MTEPLNLTELREKAEAATQGEWSMDAGFVVSSMGRNARNIVQAWHFYDPGREANADYFVAAQPRNVLALLDRLAAAERRGEVLERERDEALEIERCGACLEILNDGDLVLLDDSLDTIHAACCGPERESYTLDGEPLGPDDPIPTGYSYERDTAERQIASAVARAEAAEGRLALMAEALKQAALELDEGAALISANFPRAAPIFKAAANKARALTQAPAPAEGDGA